MCSVRPGTLFETISRETKRTPQLEGGMPIETNPKPLSVTSVTPTPDSLGSPQLVSSCRTLLQNLDESAHPGRQPPFPHRLASAHEDNMQASPIADISAKLTLSTPMPSTLSQAPQEEGLQKERTMEASACEDTPWKES